MMDFFADEITPLNNNDDCRLDVCESKKSYPNFTPSGYWTLRNRKTRALSLVGLSLSIDSLATDFVSGGAAVLRNAHALLEEKILLVAQFTRYRHVGQEIRSR